MTSESTRDYERLAAIARRRRADIGLALNDANAKLGGLSNRTWQRVEKGLEIRETNYVKVDKLLLWAPGSCLQVLEGGDPAPIEIEAIRERDEVIAGKARDVVQLALIATAKDTTAEEIREMSKRVVQDLRDRGLLI